jgi:uncharacterized protein YegL
MSDDSEIAADRPPNYAENTAERVPCMLVLDASGTMATKDRSSGKTRIDLLNEGIKALGEELRTDQIAVARVQIAAILVGGARGEAKLLMDWTDALDFIPFRLKAGGTTPLGAGSLLALEEIKKQKRALKDNGINYYRPWMIVMTDGEPTDDGPVWREACKQVRESEARGEVVVFPVGVGEAKLAKLSELSVTKPRLIEGTKFREFFVWLSRSMEIRAKSAPGQKIELPDTQEWSAWSSVKLEA